MMFRFRSLPPTAFWATELDPTLLFSYSQKSINDLNNRAFLEIGGELKGENPPIAEKLVGRRHGGDRWTASMGESAPSSSEKRALNSKS